MPMLEFSTFRRPKIQLIRQNQISECGLAALAMIANFHGSDIDLGTMRRRYGTSLRGAPLKTLMSIADQLGLVPRAVKLPLDKLSKLHVPAIIHWDLNHYVVLEGVSGDRALIHNPDGNSSWIELSEVSNYFTGAALELRPGAGFERKSERERLRLWQLWSRMSGLKRSLVQVLALTFVLQAYVLASPYYLQVAVDTALTALDHDLLAVLAIGFGLFAILNAGASLLRSLVLLATGSTVAFSLASNVGRRLFRLPIDWFEKRHSGDVLSRFQSVTPIQHLLTQGTVAAIVDGSLTLLTLVLMLWYGPTLAALAIFSLLLYSAIRLVLFNAEWNAQEASIVARGKEQTTLIETLRGITTLRLFTRESTRHAFWQSKLTEAVNADYRLARLGIWQAAANTLLFGLESILSIWLAVSLVIDGRGFSLGMLFAFMAYKSLFLQRAIALIDQAVQLRIIRLHLERLSDIALSDEDLSFGPSMSAESHLKGAIKLEGVFFRYAPDEPAILQGIDIEIAEGEQVAITGPSGGGKSTLAKIILGLLEPTNGRVLIDGLELSQFGYRSFREQVGAVLQEDSLFAGSIAENIALFEDRVDMGRLVHAARSASIHDEIMAMPMQYESLVGEMGSALSGGQKQRILMARALYRMPQLLVIDEGTSHLDLEHERIVNSSIKKLGITRIIIAHRPETIALADRVLLMKDGQLKESEGFSH